MRKSVYLAAAALCLGAASSAWAGGIFAFNPFAPTNGVTYNAFAPSNGVNTSLLGGAGTPTSTSGTTQATFPSPGASLSGPRRLVDLMPNLHSLSNTHYIGFSVFPSQTDQYLAQFGYQKLH